LPDVKTTHSWLKDENHSHAQNHLAVLPGVALCGMLLVAPATLPAIEWQSGPGFRYADLPAQSGGRTGFTLLSGKETGILFTNLLSEERGLTNQIYHNGSGVALGDVDGDGLCDIYLGNIDGGSALYRNLGNWKFEEIAARAGVARPGLATTGVLFADVDGDGDLDLIVNAIGLGTSIFLNDGHGHFADSTPSAGTAARTGSISAAMADIDGDGFLDLYVTNYRTSALRDEPFTSFTIAITNGQRVVAAVNGKPTSSPELVGRFTVNERDGIVEHGEVDVLFHNNGRGGFTPVLWTNGAFLDEDGRNFAVPYEYGLAVMMRDLNEDGLPDIYVCNDFDSEDRIWINRGHGTFQLIPRLALRQTSLFSMGVDVADVDRDGHDDIFVVDMLSREHTRRMVQLAERRPNIVAPGVIENRPQYMRNVLFWNQGDGTYAEVARFAGLEASEWSWTPIFLDVDLDGYEDLLVSNGNVRDGQNVDYVRRIQALKRARSMSAIEQLHLRKIFPKLEAQSLAFRNLGHLRFEDVSQAWGFNTVGIKQGTALADLDNDGDLDVVVNSLGGPALIYRNDVSAPRVAVRLKGKAPNTRGVGAKITVLGGPVPQSQQMICGGRYLSGDDFERVFAAGNVTNQLTIEVVWRNGRRSVVTGARANRVYEIDEESTQPEQRSKPKPSSLPLFKDVSALLAHRHHEEDFNDFERQPLLVRKLSQPGPGVSWFDLDGDGFDDLLIASGRGGEIGAFRNNGRGGFEPLKRQPFNAPVDRDQTTVIGIQGASRRILVAGSCNYEDGRTNGGVARVYDLTAASIIDNFLGQESSIGPLALADVDGDGELDLFIGGRVVPGRYPEAASSLMFRGVNGRWVSDAENTKQFMRIGLVTSAVFSDLDGDGYSDLVLACEWGPVRLFHNDHGRLLPWNVRVSGASLPPRVSMLSQLTGWWNSVAVGDFNGDGRMDIVGGNWGENTGYQSLLREPLHIYFGDFNGDGVIDMLEAGFDSSLKKIVPLREPPVVTRALPSLMTRFTSYEAYGRASVADVIGDKARAQELTINTMQSMVFLNRGTNFESVALPLEAQLSPVFGIGVADFDGDGNDDLVLAQNFFAVDPLTSRYDGGRGVLLRGNGDGTFRAMSGQESGIAVYGEGRGVAVCDYDGDGRVDVCVGQNGAQTKLYQNERAELGLRVRLQGPANNPQAVGALLRPGFANNKLGPAREIHAGSGWLSQDSAVQVFSSRQKIESISVQWPGGNSTLSIVPTGANEVEIERSGTIQVRR
jgi:hypothetical protein